MASPNAELAPHSDDILVERLRDGDRESFEMLYDRYFQRVYNFVNRRLRSREDTEETVQEVFFSFFSSIDSFRGDAPFGAWLFGITRRTVAGRFKKRRHDTVPLQEDEAERANHLEPAGSREPDPHEAYEFQELLARMARALNRDLTDEQRNLFRLHHLQHRSIQEIAESLSKSEDAVKSHLYRARKALLAR